MNDYINQTITFHEIKCERDKTGKVIFKPNPSSKIILPENINRPQDKSKTHLLSNRSAIIDSDFVHDMYIKYQGSYNNENEVMLALSKEDVPLHVYHDLRKIKLQPELRISATIRWCNDHKLLLEEQKYRTIVEALLLQDTLFIDQIIKNPCS